MGLDYAHNKAYNFNIYNGYTGVHTYPSAMMSAGPTGEQAWTANSQYLTPSVDYGSFDYQ